MADIVQTESGYSTTINDESGPFSEEESKPRMTHSYYCDMISYYFDECLYNRSTPNCADMVKYFEEQYEAHINDERGLNVQPEYYI